MENKFNTSLHEECSSFTDSDSHGSLTQETEYPEESPLELHPWPNNPRTHNQKQLTKLKASIQKFGFTAPVLIDENHVILSGHGRTQAAIELGLPKIPVRIIAGLSEKEKRAYLLADNKLSELSAWDNELLKSELEILMEDDFEIETTGFSTAEIDIMFDTQIKEKSSNPDDLQENDIPQEQISRQGDYWQLGSHRILCGNSLDSQSYATLMGDDVAQMVVSDPPYNVPVNGHICGKGKTQHREFAMASGEMTASEFTAFLNQALTLTHRFSQEGSIHYYFMDWRHLPEMHEAAQPLFGVPKQLCIWVKDNGGMGSFYRSQHELVLVFKKGDVAHINNFELGQTGRYRTNIWNYPGVNSFGKSQELLKLHPTVKPVSLVADAIRDCSHRQGIILDSFGGSGTSLIAAERTGRQARLIELDPGYVDVTILRWQRITGNEAILLNTGQSWHQIVEERRSLLPRIERRMPSLFAGENVLVDSEKSAEPVCVSSIPLQPDHDSPNTVRRFSAQNSELLLDRDVSEDKQTKMKQLISEAITIIDSIPLLKKSIAPLSGQSSYSPVNQVSNRTSDSSPDCSSPPEPVTGLSHLASLNEGGSHEL